MTDALFAIAPEPALVQRFWAKVDRSGDCWVWTASVNRRGYGQFGVMCRCYLAHRVSFALHHGPFAQALDICHRCDNPPCVNPAHLFAGTALDNVRDAITKGRMIFPAPATHCQRGHALAGDNLIRTPKGRQGCRECKRENQRRRRAEYALITPPGPGTGSYQRAKTHCPQGHPYDEVNTYVTRSGKRMCRICQRIRHREWIARQRQKAEAS